MFRNQHFYHQHVKKAITAFGMIFTNININRVDGSNITQQVLRVPLSYSTKQKFLSRIALVEDADNRGEVALTLPRMGFEIQGFEFDPTRKVSPTQKNVGIQDAQVITQGSTTVVTTPNPHHHGLQSDGTYANVYAISGTWTYSTSSKTVSATGGAATTELCYGALVTDTDGNKIGMVESAPNDNTFTLFANAELSGTAVSIKSNAHTPGDFVENDVEFTKETVTVDTVYDHKYKRTFVSTPYNMSLSLYVFAKNQEDGLQIVEQIMPHFNPDFNITINDLPELGIKRDINIKLDSIDYDDDYEGEFAKRVSIIWTLNFTMKLNFYGYISDQDIIRTAIANAFATDSTLASENDYVKITASATTTTATAIAKISNGAVSQILLTYQGGGYINPPIVTLSGNATAVSVLNSDGTLNSIRITDAGSGYTSAPTVTIENPPNTVDPVTPADPYRFIAEFENVFSGE